MSTSFISHNSFNTSYRHCSTVDEAAEILGDIVREQDGGDANYFKTQLNRYRYSVNRITELYPPPCRILDIGSHYLHQATMLSLLGYEVSGLDVPLFTDAAFVRARSEAMRIQNFSSTAHQSGEFLQDGDDMFDLVVCTEILEHIAFNPVAFWHRVWHLLPAGGAIYLTTPNAFRVRALVKAVIRLITLEGIGLPVNQILSVITYGHHWKEYTSSEIAQYFRLLSPDFRVETHTYPDSECQASFLSRGLELIPPFRTNIEAIITLHGKTRFAESPVLPMMLKANDGHRLGTQMASDSERRVV